MARYEIEDTRDALEFDVDDAFADAKAQRDLYYEALNRPGAEVESFADDGQVCVRVKSDNIDVLRIISVNAELPWLTVLDRDEDEMGWRELLSAEDIGGRYFRAHQFMCACGLLRTEFASPLTYLGHLGICLGTREDGDVESRQFDGWAA